MFITNIEPDTFPTATVARTPLQWPEGPYGQNTQPNTGAISGQTSRHDLCDEKSNLTQDERMQRRV